MGLNFVLKKVYQKDDLICWPKKCIKKIIKLGINVQASGFLSMQCFDPMIFSFQSVMWCVGEYFFYYSNFHVKVIVAFGVSMFAYCTH